MAKKDGTITGNKGEWSELYAFLYYVITAKLTDWKKNIYDITRLLRYEDETEKIFIIDGEYVTTPDNKRINRTNYESKIPLYLKEIIEGEGSFSCPMMESAMKNFGITKIKSSFDNKDDLRIQFRAFGVEELLGFNVKSDLGSSPSLINASNLTNFIYKLIGNYTDKEIDELNRLYHNVLFMEKNGEITYKNFPQKLVKAIYDKGWKLNYIGCDENFQDSLSGPEGTGIFQTLTLNYYKTGEGCIYKAVDQLNNKLISLKLPDIKLKEIIDASSGMKVLSLNAGKFKLANKDSEILKKIFNIKKNMIDIISQVLGAHASYRTPSKKSMDRNNTASGGWIHVEKDGAVVCDSSSFKNDNARYYLYETAKIDTPSVKKHGYGFIYSKGNDRLIKLNLNIKMGKPQNNNDLIS